MAGVVAGEGVRPLVSSGEARTEGEEQSSPVLVTHHAVEQEVAGGVHRGEEVKDVAQAQHDGTRRTVFIWVVKYVYDQHHCRRRLADDEQDDHRNQR